MLLGNSTALEYLFLCYHSDKLSRLRLTGMNHEVTHDFLVNYISTLFIHSLMYKSICSEFNKHNENVGLFIIIRAKYGNEIFLEKF